MQPRNDTGMVPQPRRSARRGGGGIEGIGKDTPEKNLSVEHALIDDAANEPAKDGKYNVIVVYLSELAGFHAPL